MVQPSCRTFEINGLRFREVYNETVGGRLFYNKQECIDYAYGRSVATSYTGLNTPDAKALPKKNRAIPPKKKDLKY